MVKKNTTWILLNFLITILFILGALFKTISDDPMVVGIQWFCALAFAGLGIYQLVKVKPTGK